MPYNSNDNTRVNRPLIQEPIKYKLQPGEVKLPSGQIIKVKQAELSYGSSEPEVLRDKRYKDLTRQHEQQKQKERETSTIQGLTAPLQLISPSHVIGSANSDKPFLESYLGDSYNSATGNMIGDFALDAVVGGGLWKGAKVLFKSPKIIKNFKDDFGNKITPKPYQGPDSDLIQTVANTHKQVLRDYFSPQKINQIKTTMGWGDKEIQELQQEILRSIGGTRQVQINVKGLNDGVKEIAFDSSGLRQLDNGSKEGFHIITLNRDRIPNLQVAEESGIHEIGVHAKTIGMDAENFGKGGLDDAKKIEFPRLAAITKKNMELSDNILQLNRRGKFLNQFKNSADLERYMNSKGIPWDRYNKFNIARKRFNYVNQADEKTARGYTGQLFEKLHGVNTKTKNIEQLEQYFTPESVEKFKRSVLGIMPTVGMSTAIMHDK